MGIGKIIRKISRQEGETYSIRADRHVVFFPTVASMKKGIWRVPVHGWIYRPVECSRLRRAGLWLSRQIASRRTGKNADQMLIFRKRAGSFLADNARWERIAIALGGQIFRLKKSAGSGHFKGEIKLAKDQPAGWRAFRAMTAANDPRLFEGRMLLLPEEGLSVISDIDDTIKVTEVADRRKMLRNTFLEDFADVPDMAKVYRGWADRHGAAFHYVSASPWHLYPFLSEFLKAQCFPEGSFHLRDFRLMPGSLRHTLRSSGRTKIRHARALLRRFPRRKFVLVGDSGESDAKIYAKLFVEFPGQVQRILVRDVTGDGDDAPRWKKVFVGVPRDSWQIFRTAGEIAW